MALFKILRGNEAMLPEQKTDGYAYYCTDTHNFYIDHLNENGELVRSLNGAGLNTTEYGMILNDLENNWVDGAYSLATGTNTKVGLRAYYIQAIDTTNHRIYLSNEKNDLPTVITNGDYNEIVDSKEITGTFEELFTYDYDNDGYYATSKLEAECEGYKRTKHLEPEGDIFYVDLYNPDGTYVTTLNFGATPISKEDIDKLYYEQESGMDGTITIYKFYIPLIRERDYVDSNFITPEYAVGDVFSIIIKYISNSRSHLHFVSKIKEIFNNVIIYDETLPLPEITALYKDTSPTAYTFFVPSKPEIGIVSMSMGSFAEGERTVAAGENSHAEGYGGVAAGNYSHVEGVNTRAGYAAHAEGYSTTASIAYSHAEGLQTQALGRASHSEGWWTEATGENSHAENANTKATGLNSHAEGQNAVANGKISHAEGSGTVASGECSHAEGDATIASNQATHAEGMQTQANGLHSHAEGDHSIANGDRSHAEGYDTIAEGEQSHAEGGATRAIGMRTHAEGQSTIASGSNSHAEGYTTKASGTASHAEGYNTVAEGLYSHSEGFASQAKGTCAHSEGHSTHANGTYSHAEGYGTNANGTYSHSEGNGTKATGDYSHTEGDSTVASGARGHAEGWQSKASGGMSHAEGAATESKGSYSHSEGHRTLAEGAKSHAEGNWTTTNSVAEGAHVEGDHTIAYASYQHVEGKYNDITPDKNGIGYAHITGGGTSETNRKNIYTLDWFGNAEFAGDVSANNIYVDGREVLKTGVDSTTIGKNGYAEGKSTIVGIKGFYYSSIEFGEKTDQITLTDTQNSTSINNINDEVAKYAVGSLVSVVNNSKFPDCAKIISIDGNVLTVSKLPFTSVQNMGDDLGIDDYSFYVRTASNVGVVTFGECAHAEGDNTKAFERASHAEGRDTMAVGQYSHAEGRKTKAEYASHAEGYNTTASGTYGAHAEGYGTTASGMYGAHAEGNATVSSGSAAHAEGYGTIATANDAHAEGDHTEATEAHAHAEGYSSVASGTAAHAEGYNTEASKIGAHAEGCNTIAKGDYAHAEGDGTVASHSRTHAEGYGTIAAGINQHVQGKWNVEDTENKYAHIVGGGHNQNERKNIHTLDWSGNAEFAGNIKYNYEGNTVNLGDTVSNLNNKIELVPVNEKIVLNCEQSQVFYINNIASTSHEITITITPTGDVTQDNWYLGWGLQVYLGNQSTVVQQVKPMEFVEPNSLVFKFIPHDFINFVDLKEGKVSSLKIKFYWDGEKYIETYSDAATVKTSYCTDLTQSINKLYSMELPNTSDFVTQEQVYSKEETYSKEEVYSKEETYSQEEMNNVLTTLLEEIIIPTSEQMGQLTNQTNTLQSIVVNENLEPNFYSREEVDNKLQAKNISVRKTELVQEGNFTQVGAGMSVSSKTQSIVIEDVTKLHNIFVLLDANVTSPDRATLKIKNPENSSEIITVNSYLGGYEGYFADMVFEISDTNKNTIGDKMELYVTVDEALETVPYTITVISDHTLQSMMDQLIATVENLKNSLQN